MPTLDPLYSENPCAPSELILLNGDQFAAPARFGNNVNLLHVEGKVSVEQLGQAVLTAAFLSAEQAGDLCLEARQKKAMMGLRQVTALYAVPGQHSALWPEQSLEHQLGPLAQRLLADKQRNEVSNMVYVWLARDSAVPWTVAIDLVKQGLASRGLLEQVEEKKLKLFTSRSYVMPESTAVLLSRQSVAPVKDLLVAAQRDRPDLWQLLTKQIKDAISRRTEKSDVDY